MRGLLPAVTALVLGVALGACGIVEGLGDFSSAACNGGDCDASTSDGPSGDGDLEAAVDAVQERATRVDTGTDDATEDTSGGNDSTAPPPDASADASDGGARDAAKDAAPDTSPPGDAGTDCGTPDTTQNCGACGVTCTPTGASAAMCGGSACTYTCVMGHSDCNAGNGPDTDGCECATPGCCSGACETTHADGVGQNYFDCNPLGTITVVTATSACAAYAVSVGGTAADCSDGWSCNHHAPYEVCYSADGTTCATYCWGYSGTEMAVVQTCSCPSTDAGTWN